MATSLPAHLQGLSSRRIAEQVIANLGAGSPPYISIAGNRFTLVDASGAEEAVATFDKQTGPYLDVCIIDVNEHISQIYYDTPYDPTAQTFAPPACFSHNGLAPSTQAAKPQALTCASCPNYVWGSATSKISGKGIPACSQYQQVACLIPGDDIPFLLRIPPNSLKNFKAYSLKFVGQEADTKDVITRISFEPQGVGTLIFQAVSYIDAAMATFREQVLAAKTCDPMIGRADRPRQGLPAAPPATEAVIQVPATPLPPAALAPTPPPPTPTAATLAAEAPPRRKRRTQAEIAAAETPASTAPAVAPFRPVNGPGLPFGIGEGVAPNAELAATLDSIFK